MTGRDETPRAEGAAGGAGSPDAAARDPWNVLLWQPGTGRPHVESLFLKLYVPERRQALWLQFGARTFERGAGEPHGHVMAARFDAALPERNAALKQRFAPADVAAARDRLDLRMGDCHLSAGHTAGRLADGDHTIAWELRFTAGGPPLYHLPWAFLYRLPVPKTKATSPVPHARFDGWFEVDGERVDVRLCPGMQGHNWGREHALGWCWAHANHLSGARPEAAEAVFEGLTARVKLAGLTTPWLSALQLRYGHLELRFDTLRQPFAIRSEPEGHGWRFVAADRRFRLTGRVGAEPEAFVGVHYPNPDGRVVHCANASAAALELVLETRDEALLPSRADTRGGGRWRVVDTLRTTESAAFEVAGPAALPGVAELVTT